MTARRAVRYGLFGVAGLLVLAVAAVAIVLARFDPNSLKPRIEAAVQQSTGRTLALNGPIQLTWSLWPTIALSNVALANPPGFSRPEMATLQGLDVQLAVLPLLHNQIAIARLVLQHPDIMLEQDAQGRPNWVFTPAPEPAAPAPATSSNSVTAPKPGDRVSVSGVRIEDGTLTLRDDRTGHVTTLTLTRLTATAASPDAPLHLAMTAAYGSVPFTLDGDVGSLLRLQEPDATTPWPVKLQLAVAGATASVNGSLTKPLQGRGYNLAIDATIPDLMALAPLLPAARLPPLHDVQLAARISDGGGPVPHIDSATLKLGAADLSGYVGGLQLVSVDIAAPAQDQPVHIATQATMGNTPVSLDATLGAPGTLESPKAGTPVPVDLTFHAADASLTVKGTVTHPETLSGADLALDASIPTLAALSPVAHRPLPALTRVAFQAHLTDGPGGFEHGATLHAMKLTAAQGDLSGDLTFANGPPPSLTGTLHANRIDADALMAAAGKPVTSPAALPSTSSAPGNPQVASATPPAPKPPTATPPRSGEKLFSNTPLPFGLLRDANTDLALTVGDLRTGGLDYRGINLHAVLLGGKLRLDPLAADLPEGALTGSLAVDATAPAPPVTLTLHAPGLAVAPLLAAAGLPAYASGKLGVYADLHSAGASPHAIAAALDGSLGLAMQDGIIDTALLNKLLGPVLQRANLLGLLAHGGSTELRCFALRADAQHGVATLRTLLLNSAALTMDGGGSINLGDETLALALRPQGRLAGTGIVVPLQVTGPIRAPAVKVNAVGTFEANAGSVAGGVIGTATPLGLLGGLVGGNKLLGGGPSGPSCADALAVARGESASTASASSQNTTAPPPKKKSEAGALLHQLFR